MENIKQNMIFFSTSLIGLIFQMPFYGTFIYLTFYDGFIYNSWNWLIAIPCNIFLSAIWPIYWILHFIGVA